MNQEFPREWESKRLRFRPPQESDIDDVRAMCRDAQTFHYLTHLPEGFDADDSREFLAGPAWATGRAEWMAIDRDTGKVVGRGNIARTAKSFGSAEVGYMVAPGARGHGYGAEIASGVANLLFDRGFARVELPIREDNIAGQRVAMRGGFAFEARSRQGCPDRAGKRYDRLTFTRVLGESPEPVRRGLPDLPPEGLRDGHVILRPLCADDASEHYRQLSRPQEWRRLVPPVPQVWENVKRACDYRAASEWLQGTTARLSIRDSSDCYAGNIGLHTSAGPPGETMLSYGLLPEFQGRGMVTRAVLLAARWLFENTTTVRLMAGTAIDNEASQAVLRRAGFTSEGVQRALLPGPDGERVDTVCWSLLRSEL